MTDPTPDLVLTVLGRSGSYPGCGADGACSGYLVQGGGANVIVDFGPGSLANLQHHIGLDQIDAVVLTHSHPDHWTDLAGLRVARKYGLLLDGLPVYGTAETERMAAALCDDLAPTFVWHEIGDDDTASIGGLRLRFSRTDHYVETLAVRVDGPDGTALGYSADTGPGWSFERLGPGLDLALCESTYVTDEEVVGVLHLSAGQAGAMARAAGVGRLLLTHLWPESDPTDHARAAEATFGAPVEVATVGARYELTGGRG